MFMIDFNEVPFFQSMISIFSSSVVFPVVFENKINIEPFVLGAPATNPFVKFWFTPARLGATELQLCLAPTSVRRFLVDRKRIVRSRDPIEGVSAQIMYPRPFPPIAMLGYQGF
jgi:hypothetical protein